jgi:molybdate transport system substrate-binding protein
MSRRERNSWVIGLVLAAVTVALASSGWVGLRHRTGPRSSRLVRVAAASDLRFALPEIIDAFRKHDPEIGVDVVFGSSGTLFAQICQDAPFDVFLSADMALVKQVIDTGRGDPESAFVYGIGEIVLWLPKNSKLAGVELDTTVLHHPLVKKIAIANPKHAPYGRIAVDTLKKRDVYERIADRLVYCENVVQAAQVVEAGAADLGIIALSLALAPPLKDKGHFRVITAADGPRLEQGCVVLRQAADREAAARFCRFLRSGPGIEILRRYGFRQSGG